MKKQKIKVCPICGMKYSEHSALSRKDNKTEICPTCGLMEALEAFRKYEGNKK